jgi:hypothetical protein
MKAQISCVPICATPTSTINYQNRQDRPPATHQQHSSTACGSCQSKALCTAVRPNATGAKLKTRSHVDTTPSAVPRSRLMPRGRTTGQCKHPPANTAPAAAEHGCCSDRHGCKTHMKHSKIDAPELAADSPCINAVRPPSAAVLQVKACQPFISAAAAAATLHSKCLTVCCL